MTSPSLIDIAHQFNQVSQQWREGREDSLSLEPIEDPVMAACGHIFSKQSAIHFFGHMQEENFNPSQPNLSPFIAEASSPCPLCRKPVMGCVTSIPLSVFLKQGDTLTALGMQLVQKNKELTSENQERADETQELYRELKTLRLVKEKLKGMVTQLEQETSTLMGQISELNSKLAFHCESAHFICQLMWQAMPDELREDNGEKIMRLRSKNPHSLLESIEVIGYLDHSSELRLSCWSAKQPIFQNCLLSCGILASDKYSEKFYAKGFADCFRIWHFLLKESIFENLCQRQFVEEICTRSTNWKHAEHKLSDPFQEAKKFLQRLHSTSR